MGVIGLLSQTPVAPVWLSVPEDELKANVELGLIVIAPEIVVGEQLAPDVVMVYGKVVVCVACIEGVPEIVIIWFVGLYVTERPAGSPDVV